MKPLLTMTLTLASVAGTPPGLAAEQSLRLSVPGMYCASCPFIVEAAISKVDGVVSVQADAVTKEALVVYDDAVTSVDDITFASASAGYDATPVPAGS